MMQVCLVYNAYQETMRIMVDGQPLNNISSLTKYQSMPFGVWCDRILPQIAQEVNDEYELTFVGRTCESRLLAMMSARVRECRSFKPQSPQIADSAAKRLRKLHQLCVSGLAYNQFSENLVIYSDLPPDDIEGVIKSSLPKLCFCRIRLQVKTLSDLPAPGQESVRYIISHESNAEAIFRALCNSSGESYVILLSSENGFHCVQGSCIAEKVTPDSLPTAIMQYLEMGFFIRLLEKAMKCVTIDEKDINYPAFQALDKTEPQTYAQIPAAIETGQTVPIRLYTVPEGYTPTALQYRISNTDILQIRDNALYCAGTGTAVIEVYQAGQSVCMNRFQVVAHKRNRIKSLKLSHNQLHMCVGDKRQLSVHYEPEDADNVSTIRFRSDDGTVASAIDGSVLARKAGFTKVQVATDNGVSTSCEITVFPKLERIDASLKETTLPFNGVTSVQVERFPKDATLDELVYMIVPNDIAVFDRAGMNLAARKSGSGKLVITDKRKLVTTELAFSIKPESMRLTNIFKIISGIVLVLAVIALLMHL